MYTSTYQSGVNYFSWCASSDINSYMFKEFETDACVIVHDIETFCDRMNNAVQQKLPGWFFTHNPINYYDPCERTCSNEVSSPSMSKEFKFAWQKEYRLVWLPVSGERVPNCSFFDIEIGGLHNIGEYVEKSSYVDSV